MVPLCVSPPSRKAWARGPSWPRTPSRPTGPSRWWTRPGVDQTLDPLLPALWPRHPAPPATPRLNAHSCVVQLTRNTPRRPRCTCTEMVAMIRSHNQINNKHKLQAYLHSCSVSLMAGQDRGSACVFLTVACFAVTLSEYSSLLTTSGVRIESH